MTITPVNEIIAKLAREGTFPEKTNLAVLSASVEEALKLYCPDLNMSPTNRNDEISKLYKAASSEQPEKTAVLFRKLSLLSRSAIEQRARVRKLQLPLEGDFLREDTRRVACGTIATLTQTGGRWVEKTKKSTDGKLRRWRTWEPYLLAPQLPHETKSSSAEWKRRPKKGAEKIFISWLRLAWLEATGKIPSATAKRVRTSTWGNGAGKSLGGPFVRFVEPFLKLAGATDASAVNLINELNNERQKRVLRTPIRNDRGSVS
jgi:hypothetical protein